MSKFTRFATSASIALWLLPSPAFADANTEILKKAILSNGLPPAAAVQELSPLGSVGKLIFASEALSLNGNISCQQCHLDEFGTGDGIPISVGVSGQGTGSERVDSAYRFLPRNSLPLWGRGADDFATFFWDGRVDAISGEVVSLFGEEPPSDDPLTVAVHLPPVETVEMLKFDKTVLRYRTETVEGAQGLYREIVDNLRYREPKIITSLAQRIGKSDEAVEFIDIAKGISKFISERFAIQETRLHRFAFSGGDLTNQEIKGGLIFYGKGRCVVCHNGPHFSDFDYYTVPFPQLGQGRNGFGIDYGRFNITQDPADLYKFRTPPLWDVTNTAPYGHSGSVASLEDAIRAHYDPLSLIKIDKLDDLQRHELYKYLMSSETNMLSISYLTEEEVAFVVTFLRTLSQSTPD
ncbi:His-Xaa-Ser system-associated MauG-like protein [Minwuia sp. IMCC3009]|uniref:His-Xaa-Ser system-associated MauG-like protein n=1 Tax=Minwuia sp. IMCC3009 TaxID=3040674 RepID=UPI002478D6AF|nr:His-Xaa-Ser system-associated MauG-like protein [Minwuia sp. IMCC3009]